MIAIGMRDAYLHISILLCHTKKLRFASGEVFRMAVPLLAIVWPIRMFFSEREVSVLT